MYIRDWRKKMRNFEIPTNIKQIGAPNGGLKIYVEDYVCSYLRQFAESGEHTEKIAYLVGKHIVIDNEPYVFISGAIQGKHSQFKDNMESFTPESHDYAQEQLSKYFQGMEMVGWMQSQPGYGVYLNPAYADYHMNNFTRPYNVLFVMDPAEKLNLFYSWNKEMNGINEESGYFVYYDQNKGMQEYMQDNRIARTKPAPPVTASDDTSAAHIRFLQEETENQVNLQAKQLNSKKRQNMNSIRTTPSPIAEKKAGKTVEEMRKMSNLLVGLCAVLFITSFILGAGLLQSDGRISDLESAMMTMDSNNLIIADQIRQLSAVTVFAPSDAIGYESPAYTPPATEPPVLTAPPQPPAETQPTIQPNVIQAPNEPVTTSPAQPNTEIGLALGNVPEYYVIQPGDNLLHISRMFFGDASMVDRIMELNGMTNADMITIGQTLILPQQ